MSTQSSPQRIVETKVGVPLQDVIGLIHPTACAKNVNVRPHATAEEVQLENGHAL